MVRLTDKERDLAAEAVTLVARHVDNVAAGRRRDGDVIRGAFHERIVGLIGGFDASASSLKTWAHRQLDYAILAAGRVDRGNESDDLRRVHRIATVPIRDTDRDRREYATGRESRRRDLAEAAEHMLAALAPEQAELFRLHADGHKMHEVSAMAGHCASWASQTMGRLRPELLGRLAELDEPLPRAADGPIMTHAKGGS